MNVTTNGEISKAQYVPPRDTKSTLWHKVDGQVNHQWQDNLMALSPENFVNVRLRTISAQFSEGFQEKNIQMKLFNTGLFMWRRYILCSTH